MASAIACDICGEEVAVMMQSNLSNGDSQAIGQQCLLTFSLSSALAFADGIPPEVAAGFRELLAALVTVIAPDLLMPEKPSRSRRNAEAVAEAPAAMLDENPQTGDMQLYDADGREVEMDGAGARIESTSL